MVPHPRPTPRRGRRSLIGAAIAAAVLLRRRAAFLDDVRPLARRGPHGEHRPPPAGRHRGALRHDGAPPLYYYLLHFWIQLFGEGDLAVRSLSGVFGVATLPVMWVAARRLAGRAVAWTALVLLATSPFGIRYGTEARMYSLVTLLTVVGYLALMSVLESPTPWRLLGAGPGHRQPPAHPLLGDLSPARHRTAAPPPRPAGPECVQTPASPSLAMAAGSLLFVPWLPTFLSQLRHTGTPWAEPATFQAMVNAVSEFAGGVGDAGRGLAVVILAVAGLAVFGRPVDRRRIELDLRTQPRGRGLAFVVAATLVIAIGVGLVSASGYSARYTAVVFGLFILLHRARHHRVRGPAGALRRRRGRGRVGPGGGVDERHRATHPGR